MVNWLGLACAMRRTRSLQAYAEFDQASVRTFDPYMPASNVGALVGNAMFPFTSGPFSLGDRLPPASSGLYAAVLAINRLRDVPVNREVASWSPDAPPADWTRLRDTWVRWHIVCTIISLPVLGPCVLAGGAK